MRLSFRLPRIHAALIAAAVLLLVLTSALVGFAEGLPGEDSPADSAVGTPQTAGPILIGGMHGAIGPVTKDYVHRVLGYAKTAGAGCVIFTMDTPGGLDASMRSIIKDIFASPVPVVIFVYPSGGRAASAGALITIASHVAAMAPGTNIGAAHPVAVGQGEMDENMAEKVTNDAAAYARGIAKERGRDVEWAEKIVRESISSTAKEAEELGVVDLVAANIDELIERLDGRHVVVNGIDHELSTVGAERIEIGPSFRERLLARISDPNIAYLLMLLGIFGIFFELQNPGAIFPGVVGAIAILLAFFALQLLPVNLAGLALIVLAIVMFLLEIKIPSGGLLTVGGVVSMFIGSIMLIDSPLPFMRVSISVIIPAVLATALFFVFAVGMGLRAQRRKVTTGGKGIVGETGVAKTDIADGGSVFVHGEHWNAVSEEPIPANSKIRVVGIDGMVLKVKMLDRKEV